LDCSIETKRQLIDPGHCGLTISRQCQLVSLPRSSFYYEAALESEENLRLMRLIDEQYTRAPFYGSPRMTAWLGHQGHQVNHKRVERLLRLMGLEAIYPKPNLSLANPAHRVYPYLLKGTVVAQANQVWCTDIT
jgi:putative transposase